MKNYVALQEQLKTNHKKVYAINIEFIITNNIW